MTLADFWAEVRTERRSVVILTSSAVLLTIAWYQGYYTFFLSTLKVDLWTAHALQFGADVLLMLIIPVLIIRMVLDENAREYGATLGDWRFGLKYLLIVGAVMTPFLYMGAKDPALIAEYPLLRQTYGADWMNPFLWEATYLVYYIAWEFHFRGFMQLGMEPRVGAVHAILIQTIVSTLIHVRKPFGETFSAIFGGWMMGILAWRTRSIVWGILLHWYIGAMTDFFCYLNLVAAQAR